MSSSLVTLRSYNENSALNAQRVDIGDVSFYFSYETIVAVQWAGNRYVIQNQWSVTTGKHLNWIDGGNKKERLEPETFKRKIEEAIAYMAAQPCFNSYSL